MHSGWCGWVGCMGGKSATRAETGKLRTHRLGDFALDRRHIWAVIRGEAMFMGAGTRNRILFDQRFPSELLARRLAVGPLSPYIKPETK